jgi:hypothetical protein
MTHATELYTLRQVVTPYADACWRMLAYDVRMLTYAVHSSICCGSFEQRMLTYADVCWSMLYVCRRMLYIAVHTEAGLQQHRHVSFIDVCNINHINNTNKCLRSYLCWADLQDQGVMSCRQLWHGHVMINWHVMWSTDMSCWADLPEQGDMWSRQRHKEQNTHHWFGHGVIVSPSFYFTWAVIGLVSGMPCFRHGVIWLAHVP